MAHRKKQGDESRPSKVQFDYIKSNYFRVIHADGVFGGITPRGQILMSIWNQRGPIPKSVIHAVTPDGSVGAEIGREARDAIVREVDVGVVFDVELARSVAAWLLDKIAKADQAAKEAANEANKLGEPS